MEPIWITGIAMCVGGVAGFALRGQFGDIRELRKQYEILLERFRVLTEERAAWQTRLEIERENLEKVQTKFSLEFENLSHKIFKESSKEFMQASQDVLSPIREKVDLFRTNVQEIAKAGTLERLTLKNTIENMMDFSAQLAKEASGLAKALKGDVKSQGSWGELILQKVLQSAGLRPDHEYVLQGSGLELLGSDGQRLQPDVVINLPDEKKIIVDAKMSYLHYDSYCNAVNGLQKGESVKKLVASIREHMRGLGQKHYSQSMERSPNFVVMFIPIEAIFALVMEAEPGLFEEAWHRSIILASPTNLLAILRTVESVWKIEKQNRNSQKIAEEGAALYDKFTELLKELELTGKHLKNSQDSFEKAMGKLSTGRGNILKRTEELKNLGLKTKKQIPQTYLQEIDS